MPLHTETVIQELCKKACATTTEAEAEQALCELRTAIHEHLRLASESLTARASAMPKSLKERLAVGSILRTKLH